VVDGFRRVDERVGGQSAMKHHSDLPSLLLLVVDGFGQVDERVGGQSTMKHHSDLPVLLLLMVGGGDGWMRGLGGRVR